MEKLTDSNSITHNQYDQHKSLFSQQIHVSKQGINIQESKQKSTLILSVSWINIHQDLKHKIMPSTRIP